MSRGPKLTLGYFAYVGHHYFLPSFAWQHIPLPFPLPHVLLPLCAINLANQFLGPEHHSILSFSDLNIDDYWRNSIQGMKEALVETSIQTHIMGNDIFELYVLTTRDSHCIKAAI